MSDAEVDHQRELEAVGLLVAGALTPGDRTHVQQHLQHCELCRDELVEVAALPALLRRLDTVGPEPVPPAATARARLSVSAQTQLHRSRRRARTRRTLVAAALLPAVLATALVVGRPAGPQGVPDLVAMQRVDSAMNVDGSLAAQERPWGTQVTVQMTWAKGAQAVLVAVGRDGTEQQAASWAAPAGERSLCQGATALTPDEVERWEVRSSEGAPLLILDA